MDIANWAVGVSGNHVTISRGSWAPKPLTIGQAHEMIKALGAACEFLDHKGFTMRLISDRV